MTQMLKPKSSNGTTNYTSPKKKKEEEAEKIVDEELNKMGDSFSSHHSFASSVNPKRQKTKSRKKSVASSITKTEDGGSPRSVNPRKSTMVDMKPKNGANSYKISDGRNTNIQINYN